MESGSKSKSTKPTSILILADFADGSWHAASFAMKFLFEKESPYSILQTYQNPKFGQLMLHNLIPHLREITKYELKSLKTKLVTKFNIEEKKINTISLEGDLNTILQNKSFLNEPHNVVLGTHGSFANSCTMQNQCLAKIIDTSKNPMFILPQKFKQKKKNKILFVGNALKAPSLHVKNQILSTCEKTSSELDILFVIAKQNQKIDDEVSEFFKKHFKNTNYVINYILNSSICKGIRDFTMNNYTDLIIVG